MPTRNAHCSYCGHPFEAAQPWPRQCAACQQTSYVNPLPVAVLLVPVDDGLLVVRRSIEPRKGLLALPGGFIGLGETWQAAGAREVWEETGLHLDPAEVQDFCALSAPEGMLLVFGLAAPRTSADLPPFEANPEASERLVLSAPTELAFPLHTEAMQRYFAQRTKR